MIMQCGTTVNSILVIAEPESAHRVRTVAVHSYQLLNYFKIIDNIQHYSKMCRGYIEFLY